MIKIRNWYYFILGVTILVEVILIKVATDLGNVLWLFVAFNVLLILYGFVFKKFRPKQQ